MEISRFFILYNNDLCLYIYICIYALLYIEGVHEWSQPIFDLLQNLFKIVDVDQLKAYTLSPFQARYNKILEN